MTVNTALTHQLDRLLDDLESLTEYSRHHGRPDVAAELIHASTYVAAAVLVVDRLPDTESSALDTEDQDRAH